ncbi:uncharacterized protein [Drosophila virilis]|uniref:EF-hand domain-containing protein n=1 Tax=Drosophila virilis TaxID=7244 RepID=B4M0L8_DROVI|nr:uncharacterized protein LOC6629585 [Drosophila virilis]EDW68397.1 uncharacterized protein Dvir_GJ22558 [Drosophila virilis]
MSTEIEKDSAGISPSTIALNILPSTETHGIGDSFMEKPLSPCNSLENLSDISAVSSFASCESFKTICKAWKNRMKSASTMSLNRGIDEFEAKLEDLTSKLDMNKNVTTGESEELAKRLSLCVVLERRSLQFTDSSEEDTPHAASKFTQRFFEPEEIRQAFAVFKLCDVNGDNFLELAELKLALEKLSVPQTHLAAKKLMAEIVGKRATRMNFCQFLLTYAAILQNNRPKAGNLMNSQLVLKARKESVNVSRVGVSGAKLFFEAKIAQHALERNPAPAKEGDNPMNIAPNT